MKLIIDIPEDEYKRMKDESIYSTHMMICAIQNGTPLDSVIEDITHEIRKYLEDVCINENEAEGIMFCLDVMDKHISGKESQ